MLGSAPAVSSLRAMSAATAVLGSAKPSCANTTSVVAPCAQVKTTYKDTQSNSAKEVTRDNGCAICLNMILEGK